MKPLTVFESHFRAAQALLKVYRLLEHDEPRDSADLVAKLRESLALGSDEAVVLLFNDMLVGIVRERAEAPPAFFRQLNLALLLRQAVVSAFTAIDVYFPLLLEQYLPDVIQVRRRNWQPPDPEAKELLKDFRLKIEDVPSFLEAESEDERWRLFAARILSYLRDETFSNPRGIQATMTLLGVEQPWRKIADKSGTKEDPLRQQVQTLTKRRNDITHRGDRTVGAPDGDPQPIDYAWASAHINAVQSIVLACDSLAQEAVTALKAEAGVV